MNPEQAAKVLAIAGTYDQRLTPPSREDAMARALAWSQALRGDMPVDWAQQAVVRHYSDQTTPVMPAHLNTAWRTHRRAEIERTQQAALLATPTGVVPMPAEVKAEWQRIMARVEVDT